MSARMKKPALAVCALLGLSVVAVAYLGAPTALVGCATCNVHQEDMEETMHEMEHALEKMTHSVEGMKALLQRSPRVAQLASAEPAVAEGLEDPQTLEELREFFGEELAVLRKMEQKWADPAARERVLQQIRSVLAQVETVRADREFQEWMAELADEGQDGRRLEAAAFPGMESADGFQAFVPAAMRGAPARSPVTEMQLFGGKKPAAKKPEAKAAAKKPAAKKPEPKKAAPKPVAKKAAPKPVAKKPVAKKPVAKKPVPKRAPPKRAPAPKPRPKARPAARSSGRSSGGGSNVPTQMGFGGYVKQARAPVEQYARQSFAPGDLGVLPPLGVWDPLGLIKTRDMRRYEEMEIKQGRIAMLATLHVIVTEAGIRWPGYISNGALTGQEPLKFSDIPGGVASYTAIPQLGWFQLVFLFAVLDQQIFPQDPNKAPGDVAGDNWVRYADDETRTFKLNVERQNGRAAMLGITGMMIHEGLGVDALYPTGGMEGLAPPTIFG